MSDKVNEILEGLNEEQRNAVCCTDGPVLIVAGAGSGKTRVLTKRIALLLENKVEPSSILALTFTKKAANEMKERIASMIGGRQERRLCMGTFHSIFARILRDYADILGYPSSFGIYDTSDSQSAIKTCIRELGLDSDLDKKYKPREILSRISLAKNELITPAMYRGDAEMLRRDISAGKARICDIYRLYQAKLKESAVMDFDDILMNMFYLLSKHSDVCEEISGRFQYIMVDEYQDTNRAQYRILRQLTKTHRNICVVGDDSQSIYGFRGARIENILNFKEDYPEAKIFRLEQNYRSTATIVEAANSLIAHNSARIPKECYASLKGGELVKVLKSYSEQDEAYKLVAEILLKLSSGGASYKDFAVLYRTNAQSRAIEEVLRRRNIPYKIYSGNSFFDRTEVKDMMAYFKLCVNPEDNEAFRRVVNKPARGLGKVTLAEVESLAAQKGISLLRAALEQPKVRPFSEMILELHALTDSTSAHSMALNIAERSGLYAFYKADTSIEGLARLSNIDELLNACVVFEKERTEEAMYSDELIGALEERGIDLQALSECNYDVLSEKIPDWQELVEIPTLGAYLEDVSLISNVDAEGEDTDDNKVALMTVHSAKGLEFPHVFVAGMEENLFPSGAMASASRDIEEERRLFYVAMTRAMKSLTLSCASSRMRNGKTEFNAPSRFLGEIDAEYVSSDFNIVRRSSGSPSIHREQATPVSRPAVKTTPDIIDPDFEAVSMTELYQGERIEHIRFGAGEILEISGRYPDMKARVKFDEYGEKLLLLKYAKLRPEKTS